MYLEINFNEILGKKIASAIDFWFQKNGNRCLDYLKQGVVQILESKIAEVYDINYFRKQIVPLERLYQSIEIKNLNKGSFSVFLNDSTVLWKTERGENIYQIGNNSIARTNTVTNFEEYWKTPIKNIPEDDFFIENTLKDIDVFVSDNFIPWVRKEIKKGGQIKI